MNRDDQDAGLAHQLEMERRRFEEEQKLLASDPGYLKWLLDELNEQVNRNEVSSESNG